MRRSPCFSKQDFIIYKIIFKLGHPENNVDNEGNPCFKPFFAAIFPTLTVGIETFRCILRLFSGMGDFDRINAHRPRWQSLPGIRVYEILNMAIEYVFAVGSMRSTELCILNGTLSSRELLTVVLGKIRLALSDACRRAKVVETPLAIFDDQQWRISPL